MKYLGTIVLLLSVLAASSCGNFSFVKPDIGGVKKIAIISCYDTGYLMEYTEDTGILGVVNAVASTNRLVMNKQLVNYAMAQFEERFKSVPGWELVPFASISKSPAIAGLNKSVNDLKYFKSDPMAADGQTTFADVNFNTIMLGQPSYPPKDAAIQMCKDLGLDAFVIIALDMKFTESLFMGTASMAVKITIYDRNTKIIGWSTVSERFRSTGIVPVVAGIISYDSPDTKKIFTEVIERSANFYGKEIPDTLAKQ